MAILVTELKQYLKSLIIWCICLGIGIFLFFRISVSVFNVLNLTYDFQNNYFLKGLGFIANDTFSGFGIFSFSNGFFLLLGAIQAMNMGMNIISKEYKYQTVDFLMTKPYKRSTIFSQKVIAAFISLIATSIIYCGSAFLVISLAETRALDTSKFMKAAMTFPMVQFIYMSLGLFIGTIFCHFVAIPFLSTIIVIITYGIGFLSVVTQSSLLRCFSPLKYFNIEYILDTGSYELPYVCLYLILLIILIILSFIVYDNHSIEQDM